MKHVIFRLLAMALTMLVLGGCVPVQKTVWEDNVFRYQNPITQGIMGGIRDAQIFEDNGKYYLIGTAPPFWEGESPGVRLYMSDNLLDWTFIGLLIDRDLLDPSVWYYDRFWAPEIAKINGKYYLLVNCRNELGSKQHPHGCCVAVADEITGPYTVLTHEAPFHGGNDLTFFEDDDGKVYAYWNGAKRMYAAEVDMAAMKPILPQGGDEPLIVFTPTPGTWDSIGIEGPYVIKHEDVYYMFYSSWSRGYEIGYATAINPLGPWTKFPGNPIYGAQSKGACKKNNLPYSGDPDNPFRAVGHNEIWEGPDGRLWISCHGIVKGEEPYLVIDPIEFDDDGVIHVEGPTYTPQEIKLRGKFLGLF
ncbi:family 43 glycosylhydrolase [Planctomycetota bacterium]